MADPETGSKVFLQPAEVIFIGELCANGREFALQAVAMAQESQKLPLLRPPDRRVAFPDNQSAIWKQVATRTSSVFGR